MHTNTTKVKGDAVEKFIYADLSYKLGGLFFRAHDTLGRFGRERQYGDFLEKLLKENGISYERERTISKTGKDVNRADFIIDNKLLIELKTKPVIDRSDYYQVQRYLEYANLFLGIIVNFQQKYLKPKRVINPKYNQNAVL